MSKNNQPVDWLTPTKQNEQDDQIEQNELEQKLISLKRTFEREIAKLEQAKEAADNKGKFGKYRFLSGVIDGLKHASAIVDDYLASLWGM